MSLWTEWTSARAWAQALTAWDQRVFPSRWPPGDPAERQAELVELLLAYAIEAAGRLSRKPAAAPSPAGLVRVRLELISVLLAPDTARALVHNGASLGPIGHQPGLEIVGRALCVSGEPERWRELARRAAEVIAAHHDDSRTGDAFDPMLELGDRSVPMAELHRSHALRPDQLLITTDWPTWPLLPDRG
ncbi:hypothetical protein [Pseudonocardia acaciae]|uniref:hypothetical protein n=1 Tax=Pseudonocardia acaciae TaxID=551276 RepID=UPI0012EE8640|nr:hypothetical protein [Pseudonocardia acaciae]